MTSVLVVSGVCKSFGRVAALEPLDLELREGEVLGLVGQNGSGKSTLLKIMAGLVQPDRGSLRLRGRPIQLSGQLSATLNGIGMVHQEQSLVPNLSVAENIFLDKPNAAKRGGLYRWGQLNEAAARQLAKIDVAIPPGTIVEDLRFSERQQVELAKVLAIEELVDHPPVILFDEPTSVLTQAEIALLFRQINRLREKAAIVFVSHRLDEILSLCDRTVVMTDGRKVADCPTADIDRDSLYSLMVGRQRASGPARAASVAVADVPRLDVNTLSAGQHLHQVTLQVAPGEIVGLLGVQGSGAEELCRALFGAEDDTSGVIRLNGAVAAIPKPAEAIRQGIGYLPANRHLEGMLKGRTLAENMVLTYGREYARGRSLIIDRAAEGKAARNWLLRLKVKARGLQARIDELSGGNQQKVVLAKWLMSRRLQLLLLDHPTRGLDPGARDDLFEVIRGEVAKGLSVMFVADTIGEVLDLSDRILIMRDGTISAEFDLRAGIRPSEEKLVQAMV